MRAFLWVGERIFFKFEGKYSIFLQKGKERTGYQVTFRGKLFGFKDFSRSMQRRLKTAPALEGKPL